MSCCVFCRLSRPLPGCCCLPGRKSPVKGGEVSDFDFAVGVVERAYAGYPDKTANRAAEYGR